MDEKKALKMTVQVRESDLLRFQFYSVYANVQGVAALIIDVLCIVYLVIGWNKLLPSWKVILLFLGLYYIAIKPLGILWKTKLMMRTATFAKPLNYVCTEEKITISQGDEQAELTWDQIWKVVVRQKDVYVFTGPRNVSMLPKEQLKNKWQAFVTMAEAMGCAVK